MTQYDASDGLTFWMGTLGTASCIRVRISFRIRIRVRIRVKIWQPMHGFEQDC